jgi:hypothetical protein
MVKPTGIWDRALNSKMNKSYTKYGLKLGKALK